MTFLIQNYTTLYIKTLSFGLPRARPRFQFPGFFLNWRKWGGKGMRKSQAAIPLGDRGIQRQPLRKVSYSVTPKFWLKRGDMSAHMFFCSEMHCSRPYCFHLSLDSHWIRKKKAWGIPEKVVLWTVIKSDCELPWFFLEVVFLCLQHCSVTFAFIFEKFCVQNKGKDARSM